MQFEQYSKCLTTAYKEVKEKEGTSEKKCYDITEGDEDIWMCNLEGQNVKQCRICYISKYDANDAWCNYKRECELKYSPFK